jgi:hypothetical protein
VNGIIIECRSVTEITCQHAGPHAPVVERNCGGEEEKGEEEVEEEG